MDYFQAAFGALGFECRLTQTCMAGELNIVIEHFDDDLATDVIKTCKMEGTKLVLVATEFITGKTFNDFNKEKGIANPKYAPMRLIKRAIHKALIATLPRIVRRFMIGIAPPVFALYQHILKTRTMSLYDNQAYWRSRFEQFSKVAEFATQIWCVSPHQLDGYVANFGKDKVSLMPMASWSSVCADSESANTTKDIDFLFTGTVTEYRSKIFTELRESGFSVKIGSPLWPNSMRKHFMARSKVCLQIRQDESWRYPSIMRYHQLLCAGANIVGERCEQSCLQEKLVEVVDRADLISACQEAAAKAVFNPNAVCRRYFDASEGERLKFKKIVQELGYGLQPINQGLEPNCGSSTQDETTL